MSEAPVAFVAGATGYVGRSVVAELAARGVRTVAHVRPDSGKLVSWRARFEAQGATVNTTPWEADAMRATLQSLAPTMVFALLGTTRSRAKASEKSGDGASDYEAVDYGLTAMLLRAAEAVPTRPVFIYLSAAGVTDTARNQYLAVRARIERELRGSGLSYVIARPAFVTGPDRDEFRLVERVVARLGDAALAVVAKFGGKSLQAEWASVTGPQLARSLVRLALEPSAHGQVVHADGLR